MCFTSGVISSTNRTGGTNMLDYTSPNPSDSGSLVAVLDKALADAA